jgi:RNA recognition motif-containing protein
MNIFVGNLSFQVTDAELRAAFEAFGQVASANVIMDKFTSKSRGFGFVEMPNAAEAKAAIEGTNNKDLGGRAIRVNEAQPRADRPPRGDHGGDRGDRGPRR